MEHVVSEGSTVAAVRGQVSSDLGGEVAILNLDAGMYYGLENVGARVWELVQEARAVYEIQATIIEEYDVEPTQAKRDVLNLLQQLADEGLIEVKGAPPP